MNYSGFAYLYDALMENAPYGEWTDFIHQALTKYLKPNRESPIVLDLACGTGNITIPLARLGYDMIGVDMSTDMLAQAQAKADGLPILFLAQDMRELDLYGTVDAALCVCDGMNYILSPEELLGVFSRVRMFLNPGGVFIFDINTEYKFKEMLADKSFVADNDGAAYEWDNHYCPDTGINEYRVTFLAGEETFMEVHRQRAYPVDVICDLLKEAGFDRVDTRDGYSDNAPTDKSPRVVFIARYANKT